MSKICDCPNCGGKIKIYWDENGKQVILEAFTPPSTAPAKKLETIDDILADVCGGPDDQKD
jgi:hypothetical protein